MAMNEFQAPPFYSAVVAIFAGARSSATNGTSTRPSADNGYFFSADTIEELARKIEKGHEFQRVPLKHLSATVRQWNSYVDKGSDPDFGRGKDAPMHKIGKPPFYAAAICPVWHDSYGGLRINGRGQVVDTQGEVIPGLYSGGESSGGGNQHGLGRALVHGYIAGTQIAQDGRERYCQPPSSRGGADCGMCRPRSGGRALRGFGWRQCSADANLRGRSEDLRSRRLPGGHSHSVTISGGGRRRLLCGGRSHAPLEAGSHMGGEDRRREAESPHAPDRAAVVATSTAHDAKSRSG